MNEEDSHYHDSSVPVRAFLLSLLSLFVPIIGALSFPDRLGDAGALLWLTALVPAFLLSYYRGWRGVATALAIGMAVLSLTQVAVVLLDRHIPEILFWVVVAYLAIAVAIGWVAELLHRQRANIEALALTDLLTHLPNRRHARAFLENEFGAAERGRPLSVVLFDLDNFKEYNDRYGHQAGDEALREFGRILTSNTRRMNLSARFGGEEFITILADSNGDGGVAFGERVLEGLRNTQLSQGAVSASAGVATYHPSMRSPDELVAAADLALYRAKREGRDVIRVFGRSLDLVSPPPADLDGEARAESLEPAPMDAILDVTAADPKRSAATAVKERSKPSGYPRSEEEIGRSRPSGSLLPYQITRFGEGKSILLVEDESGVRTLISQYLQREGFAVDEEVDPVEALAGSLHREFDVVIIEARLSASSGEDFVSSMKSRWPTTQVVVMAGFHETEVADGASNDGADQYLFKPFGIPELRSHLVDALARRSRGHDQRRAEPRISGAEAPIPEAPDTVLRSVRGLVEAAELRDPYTRGHSVRVARYSVALAQHVRSSEEIDISSLRLGAELHDVGKIAIADAILNKTGPLSPEELLEVKRHPRAGRRILAPLVHDPIVLAITEFHHERWDGQGYPHGLAGNAIPMPARIVAVADALDAMTSSRAYRSEHTWTEAVDIILAAGGGHFDPELMDAFRAALPALEELFHTSQE